jgi:hypothetical protein
MLIETLRMVADALATGSIGVNAQLASLPRDSTDEAPPAVIGVFDSTRSAQVATGRYPNVFPSLVVTLDGNVPLDGEVMSNIRQAAVTVLIRYITKDIASEQGNQATYYTLRAVQKALRDFLSNTHSDMRSRNDIHITVCDSMEHVELFQPIDDASCTGGIRATFKVRDIQP